jgi:hypothetical protein
VEGIGKTTMACSAPEPILVQTEDGASDIDVAKFPLCEGYADFKNQILALISEDHDYKNLIIDSVDWLESLVCEHIVNEWNVSNDQVSSISEIPYGKGSGMLESEFHSIIKALDGLRRNKGMGIILIAHSQIQRFESPETEPYDRFTPALNKKVSPIIREWVDELLFLNYKISTVEAGDNFGKKKYKGIGGTQRVMHTSERPSHMAKNRKNLPETLELSPEYWSK